MANCKTCGISIDMFSKGAMRDRCLATAAKIIKKG